MRGEDEAWLRSVFYILVAIVLVNRLELFILARYIAGSL